MKRVIKHGDVIVYIHTCIYCNCVFEYTYQAMNDDSMSYYTHCPDCGKNCNCTNDEIVNKNIDE